MSNGWFDHLKRDFVQGFPAYCGFRVKRVEHGLFEASVTLRPDHRQQDGFVHAGVIATLADHTAGYAAFTTITDAFRILTVEFKINYLRPAAGDTVVCRGKVIKPGKRIIVSESEVYAGCGSAGSGSAQTLVAKAMVTLTAVPVDSLKGPGP
ncbi:MAG: PaaI family thioesterase [Deltaproteobacteria bacterium]|nr:PaaI family thioesterase [Deltaproteobacteria bacterium]